MAVSCTKSNGFPLCGYSCGNVDGSGDVTEAGLGGGVGVERGNTGGMDQLRWKAKLIAYHMYLGDQESLGIIDR
jgi:hypothetical protein